MKTIITAAIIVITATPASASSWEAGFARCVVSKLYPHQKGLHDYQVLANEELKFARTMVGKAPRTIETELWTAFGYDRRDIVKGCIGHNIP